MQFFGTSREQRREKLRHWRKAFAFLPTQIGVSQTGSPIYVWLCFFEERGFMEEQADVIRYERRLPDSLDKPYSFTWYSD